MEKVYIVGVINKDMTELNELKEAAYVVRRKFESGKLEESRLAKLYDSYNPIPNTRLFVRSSVEMFPRLNCGLASLYLQDALKIGEIVRGRYKGEKHTFLLIDGRIVVDITADQYGGPKVYVGPLKSPWER